MAPGDEYFEDLLKIAAAYTGERNTAMNILYASCLGAHGATTTQLNDLAATIATQWAESIMANVIENVILDYITVADWTDADGLTGIAESGTAGSLTGDLLPDQVAVLGNMTNDLRYRGGRGRIYLPQPDSTKLLNGTTWTTAFQSDVTDNLGTLRSVINGLEIAGDLLTLVLYHRAGNKVVPQGYEDVNAITCNPVPGTQRRRVRRVGHIA